MELALTQFIETLKDAKENRSMRTALFIGWEGSRALIGHKTVDQLTRDIVGKPLMAKGEPRPAEITEAWSGLADLSRIRIMQVNGSATKLDVAAIKIIAALIHEGYFQTVVVSDIHGSLEQELKVYNRNLLRCDSHSSRSSYVYKFGEKLTENNPLFLNMHDIGLNINSSSEGLTGYELNLMREAIKNVLVGSQMVVCWGWCNFNVPIADIWKPGTQPLYLLGKYTDCNSTRVPGAFTRSIVDPTSDDTATTYLFHQIAEELKIDASDASAPVSDGTSTLSTVSLPVSLSSDEFSLVIDSENLERIIDFTDRNNFSVIGLGGRERRSRVARRLRQQLEIRSKRPQFWVDPKVTDLLQRTLLYLKSHETILVEFSGDQDQETVTLLIRAMQKIRSEMTGNEKARFTCVVPETWFKDGKPEFVSYFSPMPPDCLKLEVLTEWIEKLFSEQWGERTRIAEQSAFSRQIAQTILADVAKGNNDTSETADHLLLLLDAWRARVVYDRIQLQDGFPQDLEWYKEVWNQILGDWQTLLQMDMASLVPIQVRAHNSNDLGITVRPRSPLP